MTCEDIKKEILKYCNGDLKSALEILQDIYNDFERDFCNESKKEKKYIRPERSDVLIGYKAALQFFKSCASIDMFIEQAIESCEGVVKIFEEDRWTK